MTENEIVINLKKDNKKIKMKEIVCLCGSILKNKKSQKSHIQRYSHFVNIINMIYTFPDNKKKIQILIISFIIESWQCCNTIFFRKDTYNNHLNTDIHNLSTLDKKNKLTEMGNKNQKESVYIVEHICEIIRSLPNIEYTENIDSTGSKGDICFKFKKRSIRVCQVKTLGIRKGRFEQYVINTGKYDDNMLYLCSTRDYKHYVAIFQKDIYSDKMSFSKTCNSEYLYNNIDKFKNHLITVLNKSLKIKSQIDLLSSYRKQEFLSIQRLNKKCNELKLNFKRNIISDIIDVFIDDKRIQCKSSFNKHNKLYTFTIIRRGDGKSRIPYKSSDNIDFFICEIIEEKYINNFYIFPISILIEMGTISSDKHKGTTCLVIAPPDYDKKHWTLQYLNKFELLTDQIVIESVQSKAIQFCETNNIKYKLRRDRNEYLSKIDYINNKSIQHIFSNNEIREDKSIIFFHPKSEKKEVDIYIFEHKLSGNCYIIPKNNVYNNCKGVRVYLGINGCTDKYKWSLSYLNKFELLMNF